MSKMSELQERRLAAVPRGVDSATSVFAAQSVNAEIWDVEGRRYIDFSGGIGVVNTGHCHPKVLTAAAAQMKAFTHACFQVTPYEVYVRLAERLNALAPVDQPAKTILLSTGAEALENAIKIARAFSRRPALISFGGGFHGRTYMGMALTGKLSPYKVGFGPFPSDVYRVPFPNSFHGISASDSFSALKDLFEVTVASTSVAAIVIEPVQGEGGFNIAPFKFMQDLRALCDDHGILLIADEVQTGFARTGRLFALEHSGIKADIVTLAKSLAGGFPLAAVTGRREVMDAVSPGGLGGTYAGNPIACAAANAVLDVIEEEDLCARANKIGTIILARFNALKERSDFKCIGDVRGLGAMCALELIERGSQNRPASQLAGALVRKAAENGLIVLRCGMHGNVIRTLVPLTVPDSILDQGLRILEETLAEVASSAS